MLFIDLFAVMSEGLVWQKISVIIMKELYYKYGMDYQHLYQKTFQRTPGTIGNGTDVTVKKCYTVMHFY